MARVLLINPKFTEEVSIFTIPVGLIYLGSWLTSKGHEVVVRDYLHKVKDENITGFELVGLTVMSTQIPHALQLTKEIKSRWAVPIVWGGIHPTLYPEQTAKCEYIDYVVKGEGEYPILDILEGKAQGKAISSDKVVDINEYPLINWNLVQQIEPNLTLKQICSKTPFGTSLLTSRGCPWSCSFCVNSILRIPYRRKTADNVVRDIKDAISQGIDRIQFEDEDFFADKKRISELIEKLPKYNIKWAAGCRTSYFTHSYLGDLTILKAIKNSGCYFLGTGAESGSQRILDMVNKHSQVEYTTWMASCTRAVGIKSDYSFMIGLPSETIEEYKDTLELIKLITDINKDAYILGPQIYRPYPGSKLFEECVKQGMRVPGTLEEWVESPYIHFELASHKYLKEYYPWIQYKGDLTSLVFYATMMGKSPGLLTWLFRWIGTIRCKLFWFGFPIEKWIYSFIRGSIIERILRRCKVL